ncbi:lipopolysaccharide kinase InaA family protein [Aliarcobacter thereius]|uniref:lipopolysaccharide kinase InaA family protein n=1 Tax=Aliarcobacter thereius TaxID=544718 RepID=UPI0008286182|nr:lipopolysaccharide kinase InaA family protein [Aliarcobacter thereius]OCL94160.1 3-deoxy-D-manno-octulosonic-acid kinase [Aliarcobacter thereius]
MIKYKLNKNYENIKDFLLNIKDFFKQNSNTIHKARNELKVIDYEGVKTVVKAFKIPNIINQVVYAYFRDSKAKKSYQNAIKLQKLNINTPNPIGYIEFYRNLLFKESFFISEKLDYLFTIREPLRNNNLKDREEIIKKFVSFTYNLHKNSVYHKDYSAGNILVFKDKNDDYDFSVVDINRMEFKNIDLETALDNFSKLWLDEDVLRLIATEYAKLSQNDQKVAINILKKCDKKLKNFVELKRKLRGRN